jgi:hypothetical protein
MSPRRARSNRPTQPGKYVDRVRLERGAAFMLLLAEMLAVQLLARQRINRRLLRSSRMVRSTAPDQNLRKYSAIIRRRGAFCNKH